MLNLARRTAAAVLVTFAAIAAPAAAHDTQVKEYKLPADFAVPADITPGPDGAMYAPDGSLGRLWRITQKGKISFVELGGGPAGVAAGRDGALWVTDRSFDRIQRVTVGGRVTNYPLPTAGAFPLDIVAGPDGALWFTETSADKIGRITTSGAVTEYPLPTLSAFAADLAVGPDGAIWFTEQTGNKVGRITMSGEVTEYPLATPDALPGPIVAGPDGGLWFAEGNTNTIARITTAGAITQRFTIPTPNAGPLGLVATRRGLLIAEQSAGVLDRMTLDGRFRRPLGLRSHPDALTRGPDGDLWYAAGDEGRIGHISR
jgi:virginiamycin B lyase